MSHLRLQIRKRLFLLTGAASHSTPRLCRAGKATNQSHHRRSLRPLNLQVLGRMRGKVVCTCLGSIDRIGGNLDARTLMLMLISPGISVAATRACNRYAGHLQSILASPFVEPCRNPTKGIERRSKLGSKKKREKRMRSTGP